jgi:hypothetical protein
MGFPFLAPLKEFITKSLDEREKNKEALNTLMPFAVVSSAAVITNKSKTRDEIGAIMESGNYSEFAYKGCVVANSLNMNNNYQPGKTIVGYDLEGKAIEVEGETDRRTSVPIIESIEIDTDGGNNTLKTAQVKVKLFTLKQLEMFELFFLRPSMHVVLEYGWSNRINKDLEITKKMFSNQKHSDYLKQYTEIYSREDNGYQIAKGKYVKILEQTKGNYDFMAGKITGFNYSPESDGTYSVSLEISAGNELQLWMPVKRAKDKEQIGPNAKKVDESLYGTWVRQIAADLNNPDFTEYLKDEKLWKDEFFNWGVITEKQKETTFSKQPYISFKLIIELLKNIKLYNEYEKPIKYEAYYEDKDKKKPLIPISSNRAIISPTADLILPGKLPNIRVTQKKDEITIEKDKNGNIVLNEHKVNGKSFNLSYEQDVNLTIYDSDGQPIPINSSIGNLLNVFFNYEQVKNIWNKSYTTADIINALLDTVNNNMFGLCKLELQTESDTQTASPLIIMDRKLPIPHPKEKPSEIYRFKVGGLNSIVKEFSFNMELSTLMQAQALYSSQLAIAQTHKQNEGLKDKSEIPKKSPYQTADLSFSKNSDDYYSVNAIEVEIVRQANKWNDKIKKTVSVEDTSPPAANGQEEIKDLSEVLDKNYIRFNLGPNDKSTNLIYKDAALLQTEIKKSDENTGTSALTYLDISLAIDGIAGISCGEYFLIDGVPEIYNQNGYFQVTNVKHGIDDSGWKTTIEAGYRIKAKEKK